MELGPHRLSGLGDADMRQDGIEEDVLRQPGAPGDLAARPVGQHNVRRDRLGGQPLKIARGQISQQVGEPGPVLRAAFLEQADPSFLVRGVAVERRLDMRGPTRESRLNGLAMVRAVAIPNKSAIMISPV